MADENAWGVCDAAEAIRDGRVTSQELVRACLDRIVQFEDGIGAWAKVDPNFALAQAVAADERRAAGFDLGPLHGVPVGIKDIIDTKDLPTERGTVLHAGRRPDVDATLVSALRQAGAIILGKTVTTEMAVYAPGKTKNPHDPTRTPGGSSSGSAAAVAAFMVPVAIGTQTNGSIIRPASFCGTYAYKPSHGLISRTGVLLQSQPLDTVGVFARSLEDLALVAEPMMGFDDRDPSMKTTAAPHLSRGVASEPTMAPKFAFIRSPVWDEADDSTKDAFRELVDFLNEDGECVDLLDLPTNFADAHEDHRLIMEADLAKNFAAEYESGKLSKVLSDMIERGQKVSGEDYAEAQERAALYGAVMQEFFDDYDAVITPAATGEAPVGLESTGSPTFCTLWTLCGMPALNLPILQGPNEMPLGVQLVSYPGDDARLFRSAKWLLNAIEQD